MLAKSYLCNINFKYSVMTTLQLNAALHRELSYIVTDETMMERALKSLRKIRKERKAEKILQGDSTEMVSNSLKEAFKELKLYKDGKLELQTADDFLKEL